MCFTELRRVKEAEAKKQLQRVTIETIDEDDESANETTRLSGTKKSAPENLSGKSTETAKSDENLGGGDDSVWDEEAAMEAIRKDFGNDDPVNVSPENVFILVCEHCVALVDKPNTKITKSGESFTWANE